MTAGGGRGMVGEARDEGGAGEEWNQPMKSDEQIKPANPRRLINLLTGMG